MYNLYKKELYEYNSLLSDVRRNDQINHSIEENKIIMKITIQNITVR